MFFRPLTRASHPPTSFSALTARPSIPTTRPAFKPHQRRLSSSKASCPPHSKPPSATTTSTNSNEQETEQQQDVEPAVTDRRSHAGRRKAQRNLLTGGAFPDVKPTTRSRGDNFGSAPSVPPTSHLHESDVNLSAFFAQHRPISITKPLPSNTTDQDFTSIFSPPTPKWRPEDVIYTLNTVVTSLSDPVADSPGSMDELVKRYRPFQRPPAPVPLEPVNLQGKEKKARSKRDRTYKTTVTISESTNESGEKQYVMEGSPIVETTPASEEVTQGKEDVQQPFMRRTWARRMNAAGKERDMFAISVKRRRKLKMKKHKYKKLMRRTRNVRRREGRT